MRAYSDSRGKITMHNIIRIDAPYPTVTTNGENYYQAKCIMDDYSGKEGELTAVTEYMYYAYITLHQGEKELSEMFEGIAIAEMMHHKLLAGAIAEFGANPIFGGNDTYWTGANISYTQNKQQMLNRSIELEKTAIANYEKALACTSNESLKSLIDRILQDEYLHLEYFEKALAKL